MKLVLIPDEGNRANLRNVASKNTKPFPQIFSAKKKKLSFPSVLSEKSSLRMDNPDRHVTAPSGDRNKDTLSSSFSLGVNVSGEGG
jgi:hypothetical protein